MQTPRRIALQERCAFPLQARGRLPLPALCRGRRRNQLRRQNQRFEIRFLIIPSLLKIMELQTNDAERIRFLSGDALRRLASTMSSRTFRSIRTEACQKSKTMEARCSRKTEETKPDRLAKPTAFG